MGSMRVAQRRHTMLGEAAHAAAWGGGGSPASLPEGAPNKARTPHRRYTSPNGVAAYLHHSHAPRASIML